MARALVIEEESGTSRSWVHQHNGYYAGRFPTSLGVSAAPATASQRPQAVPGSAAPPATPTRHANRSTVACWPTR